MVSDECLPIALYEDVPFPPQEEYQWIIETFKRHYNRMHTTSLKLVEWIAIGLGLDRRTFHPWFERDSLSTQRAVHILPRSANIVSSSELSESEFKLTTPEHNDAGFVTLLSTFGYPGLQVLLDGEYKSIKPVHNELVVNLGVIFNRISDGKLKATLHRVLDIGIERFSSPFFLRPRYFAKIPESIFVSEEEQAATAVDFGPYFV